MPLFAVSIRFLPSYAKGFIAIATVRTPISLAIFAITGLAPVPVPPPIPVAINNISVSDNSLFIKSIASSAACFPMSGFEPAPSPFVHFAPSCIFVSANDLTKL